MIILICRICGERLNDNVCINHGFRTIEQIAELATEWRTEIVVSKIVNGERIPLDQVNFYSIDENSARQKFLIAHNAISHAKL